MLSRAGYGAWWNQNTDEKGELRPLDEPTATLAAHVQALQERLDRLRHPDDLTTVDAIWSSRCACAYDHPGDVCMSHKGSVTTGSQPSEVDRG